MKQKIEGPPTSASHEQAMKRQNGTYFIYLLVRNVKMWLSGCQILLVSLASSLHMEVIQERGGE